MSGQRGGVRQEQVHGRREYESSAAMHITTTQKRTLLKLEQNMEHK